MRIRSPGANDGLQLPAALVTISARTPSAPSTRAGSATVAASCPSYPWMRPWRTRTEVGASFPYTIRPLWPGTVAGGNPGSSANGSARASVRASANAPSPDPSPTATRDSVAGSRGPCLRGFSAKARELHEQIVRALLRGEASIALHETDRSHIATVALYRAAFDRANRQDRIADAVDRARREVIQALRAPLWVLGT